jgi:MFS transporter, DHA3 family, macrolide efflux protein
MKKFFIIWISQAASLLGSSLVGFALAWYLTQETGSATVLATAMMLNFLPQIILGPFIGPYIDRWNRKKIIIISDFFVALVTACLVILFLTDTIQVWHIYIAMVARAIGGTFQSPAVAASISLIVPEKHLARAAGLNQMLGGVINIAAPPAGALLMETLPMYGVLAVDIITAVIAIACIVFIMIPQPERTTRTENTSAITEMVQGFRYVWSWRGLALLLGIFSLSNFFLSPTLTLTPVFVSRYLDNDVLKLAWIESSAGIGIIAGGLVLGIWGGFKHRMYTVILALCFCGLAVAGFGFTTSGTFILGLSCAFLVGSFLAMANGPVNAIFQSIIPHDIQGRVFSIIGAISAAVTPLGLLIAGPVADAIGTRYIYYIAGIAALLLGIACLFIPSIMNLEKHKNDNPSP